MVWERMDGKMGGGGGQGGYGLQMRNWALNKFSNKRFLITNILQSFLLDSAFPNMFYREHSELV